MKSLKLSLAVPIFLFSNLIFANETSEQIADSDVAATGAVSVEWIEPEKYRDVRHPNVSKTKYRERVFAKLEAHFSELAEELPEGYQLALKVTNLDMAGEVQTATQAGIIGMQNRASAGFQEYRIMRQIDIPRMTFSYELKNSEGEVVQAEEEVKLKDTGFLNRATTRFRNRPLHYEKTMVSRWFKKTFSSAVEA
jgi:hypothetical protein